MRLGIAACLLISLLFCVSSNGAGPSLPLAKRLVSADEETRLLATEELRELRRNIVKELVGVLAEHRRTKKNSLPVPEAMELLGEMRIDDAEAICHLVALISYPHFSQKCTDELIFPQPEVSGGTVHLTMDDALPRRRFSAVTALLRIGGPATPELLRKLSDPELRFYEQKAIADVLAGTHGRQESSRLLGEARKAAASETSKKRIDETLRIVAGSKFESEAGASDTGYSLVASVDKQTFSPSEPVRLQLSLKNTGQNAIPVLRTAPLRLHEIQLVHLATKRRVGLTKRGEQMQRASQEGSVSGKPLKPGETATSEIENLAELFDLGVPGEYSLTVSRQVFSHDDPKTTIFVSAPVQYITIVTKDK